MSTRIDIYRHDGSVDLRYISDLIKDFDDLARSLTVENKKLLERCAPNSVVIIGTTGHYVSQAVAEYIDELRGESCHEHQ